MWGGFDERSTLTSQGVDHHVDVYDNLFLAVLSNLRATRQRGGTCETRKAAVMIFEMIDQFCRLLTSSFDRYSVSNLRYLIECVITLSFRHKSQPLVG